MIYIKNEQRKIERFLCSTLLHNCALLGNLDLAMELPPDYTAMMPDGSYFSFFDTGVPGPGPYTTYLLIHGLAYNKGRYS